MEHPESSEQTAFFENTVMLYENTFDSMDNGVIALDFEGKIIAFNATAAKILGVDAHGHSANIILKYFSNYRELTNSMMS